MRLLNMTQLTGARKTYLSGMKRIGLGQFANVYEVPDRPVVRKLTVDPTSYWFMSDWVWLDAREQVEQHFPKVLEDFQDVGEVNGATVYLVEVERLDKVRQAPYRKLIKSWSSAWEHFLSRPQPRTPYPPSLNLLAQAFCEQMGKTDAPYSQVFSALADFFGAYGGTLDLKLSNFMVRPETGELVFNDVVTHLGLIGTLERKSYGG